MTNTQDLAARWSASVMNIYGTPAVALVRGSGAELTDADGKVYLDFVGGIAVNALGHAHPAIIEAVTRQLSTLGHTSNLFMSPPALDLAEKLLGHFDVPGRVFFCNSGTEANEAAFKISRLTGKTKIVAAQNSFHGRTMGALALTGQPAKQAPFAPLPGDVTHVPFGGVEALRAAVDSDTAAVFLEPIMGEGGVVVPPEGYLAAARAIATDAGALLILDEVQTGIGRTGTFFAHQAAGITPDVITLAKGLGGGLPIGATIALGDAANLLSPGHHGTTFGGNPVSAAAALAVLKTIDDESLLDHVSALGKHLRDGIGGPLVDHVRGAGLLIGVALAEPLAKVVEATAREAGFLVNATSDSVLRLAPPLILTQEQADRFLVAWPAICAAAQTHVQENS